MERFCSLQLFLPWNYTNNMVRKSRSIRHADNLIRYCKTLPWNKILPDYYDFMIIIVIKVLYFLCTCIFADWFEISPI